MHLWLRHVFGAAVGDQLRLILNLFLTIIWTRAYFSVCFILFICIGSHFSCMHRTCSVDILVKLVDEIKRFLLERRQTMADLVDNKPLKDYAIPTEVESHCSIVHLPISANNFKLKPSLMGMVQQNQFIDLPS